MPKMDSERKKIREFLLRSHKEADRHMQAILTADPLEEEFFHQELSRFILAKYLLTEEDRPENDSFEELTEISLSKSMKVSPELVKQFDTAQSCDGATSAMAKKVLLFMAIQKSLHIELPAGESARVKTLQDVCDLTWRTVKADPSWQEKLAQ